MARYKRYDYKQSLLIPVRLDEQLMAGTLEHAIHTLVETRMDLSIFEQRYNNDYTGRKAYDPKVLLKVVLLGYSRGQISSRKIERACAENIVFMALSCDQRPDHSTIAAFVSSMKEQIQPLFRDVLLVCEELDLLGGTFFALDGCKLSSNASKELSGTHADLKKKKEKLEQKVSQMMQEQIESDQQSTDQPKGSNRKKQIEKLTRKARRIDKWLKENEPGYGTTGKELKRNVTDKQSAKMLTSHGMVQGYNGQALVDSKQQVIVHGQAVGRAEDSRNVPPMIDGAKANMKALGHDEGFFKEKVLTADADYHSRANLEKCQAEQLNAYIPDRRFRSRDPRYASRGRHQPQRVKKFTRADFTYCEEKDRYICANGKVLKREMKGFLKDGVLYRRYKAQLEDCRHCRLTSRCLRRKNAKRRTLDIPIGSAINNLSKKMQAKIDSDKGRKIYPQRLAIVEPVFANIRVQKRLDHFTLRGKIKVNIQWLLYCMVHNMEKIAKYAPA